MTAGPFTARWRFTSGTIASTTRPAPQLLANAIGTSCVGCRPADLARLAKWRGTPSRFCSRLTRRPPRYWQWALNPLNHKLLNRAQTIWHRLPDSRSMMPRLLLSGRTVNCLSRTAMKRLHCSPRPGPRHVRGLRQPGRSRRRHRCTTLTTKRRPFCTWNHRGRSTAG